MFPEWYLDSYLITTVTKSFMVSTGDYGIKSIHTSNNGLHPKTGRDDQ